MAPKAMATPRMTLLLPLPLLLVLEPSGESPLLPPGPTVGDAVISPGLRVGEVFSGVGAGAQVQGVLSEHVYQLVGQGGLAQQVQPPAIRLLAQEGSQQAVLPSAWVITSAAAPTSRR